MEERTAMSDRDLMRVNVLSRMVSGELTSGEGAELLAISVRQAAEEAIRRRRGERDQAHSSCSALESAAAYE
jgi:hypothetical protein